VSGPAVRASMLGAVRPRQGTGRGNSRIRPAACVLIVAALIPACILYRYVASPEHAVRSALSALARGDAQSLLADATHREREALNLTPDTVTAFLRELKWNPDAVSLRLYSGPRPYYEDVLMYDIDVERSGAGTRLTTLYVYQDGSGRWRVSVSMLLYALVAVHLPSGVAAGPDYDRLASAAGIRGCTIPAGPTRMAADGSHNNDIHLTRAE
jgi:hypothetical protein